MTRGRIRPGGQIPKRANGIATGQLIHDHLPLDIE